VLQQAWLTCQRHWHHMQHALQALAIHLPVLGQDWFKSICRSNWIVKDL
jgi:hypothetical protein